MEDPKELVTYQPLTPTPPPPPVRILQSLCRIIPFHLQMISKSVSPDGAWCNLICICSSYTLMKGSASFYNFLKEFMPAFLSFLSFSFLLMTKIHFLPGGRDTWQLRSVRQVCWAGKSGRGQCRAQKSLVFERQGVRSALELLWQYLKAAELGAVPVKRWLGGPGAAFRGDRVMGSKKQVKVPAVKPLCPLSTPASCRTLPLTLLLSEDLPICRETEQFSFYLHLCRVKNFPLIRNDWNEFSHLCLRLK